MKRFKARQTNLLFILILGGLLFAGCGSHWTGNWTAFAPPDTTKPTVTFTTPANLANVVAVNTKVSATFSELMVPSTISTATFTLKQGATIVNGTVSYSGLTAVFTPTANLSNTTVYTATITTGVKDLSDNSMAVNKVWTFTTGIAPDTAAPTVSFTSPAHGSTAVPFNQKLNVAFSEAMDPLSITTTSFTLKQGPTPIAGVVTYSGVSAVFTPSSNLAPSTTYTATIKTVAEDLAGNPMASDFVWSFTTAVTPDVTAPTVSFTAPLNGTTAVPFNRKINVAFSEAMDPLTVSTATFTLKQGATTVPGTVAYSGVSAVFTPTSNLAASTVYTATITTGVEDLAGNNMTTNYVWTFTTAATPDVTAPTVSFTSPINAETGVAFNRKVNVAFSEAMDPLTITTTTFTLKQGATTVLGTVAYSGVTAVFTPTSNLAPNTVYTGTITTGVEDLAGNTLASNYTWSFTTSAAPDTTAPTVSFTSPTNAETAVAFNKKVNVAFSEVMNPITITTTTFTLKQGATTVLGAITYSGVTAVFTPTSNLAPSTVYTGTITTGVEDLAGNNLASNYVWSFTTDIAPDTTKPTVSFTSPTNGAIAVPLNRKVNVAFSEVMDPLTITTTTFTLKTGVTLVNGIVTYSGTTAVFTPSSSLAPSTVYNGTITTGVEDLAGNTLASNYTWSFTTGLAADSTKPTVILTAPLSNAVGVASNTTVTGTFSEVMDPLTISTATFTLKQGLTNVTGAVTYSGTVAVFTPTSNLAFSTLYTATITNAVEDLAGNTMLVNKTWSFTTGAAPDTTAPKVTLTFPIDNSTGIGLNNTVSAIFSEAMDPTTITTATFLLNTTGPPLGPLVNGTVSYNSLTNTATFTPSSNLAASTEYTAKITVGAKDLAGNALVAGLVPNPWTFTTGTGLAPGAVSLGSAGTFGIMATSAITSTGNTVVNGDVSLDPGTSMTGFPPGTVNGGIHINDSVSAQARIDLLTAYNFATTLPPGTTISGGADLGALYPLGIPPGTYTSGSTMLVSTPLTLDAGGNADAVWVFQIGSSLTTGASVSLANGAQEKNVFWVPQLDATIGVGTIFHGTIVAGRDVTAVTGAVINGRILAGATLAGTIALQDATVNVPAP